MSKFSTTFILAFLALLLVSSAVVVNAIGIHYELDKPYYHPGDVGKLSLTSDEDVMIFGVEMDIHGIGVFKFNMTGIPEDRKVEWGPNNTLAFTWKKGETLSVEFKIPPDAKPGEYAYTWKILWPYEMVFAKTDTLSVYAIGESAPPQPFNPMLLLFIAPFALLAIYPLARWKSAKVAKKVCIAIVAAIALSTLFGGFLFLFLMSMFWPILAILVIIAVAVSIIRGREEKMAKAPIPSRSALYACSHCGKDVSTLPKDIAVCPYCGEKLAQRICSGCGKDLSQFPNDIKNCPYCGNTILIKAMPAELKKVLKVRRYAKIMTILGILFTIASFVYAQLFTGGWSGPELPLGILFTIASAIVWAIASVKK